MDINYNNTKDFSLDLDHNRTAGQVCRHAPIEDLQFLEYEYTLCLAEDAENLAAFEDRVNEPSYPYKDVVKDLKRRGKI